MRVQGGCRSSWSERAWSGLRSRARRRSRGTKWSSRKQPARSAPAFPRATARSSTLGSIIRPARAAPITAHAARRMLYAFCASHGVPHRKCGKLVVATNESERERLAAVHKQAEINGVEGIEIIDAAAAKRLEPELACVAAMRSPETGIIDSHSYHAGAAGRSRRSRRHDRLRQPDRAPAADAGRLGRRHRRQRSPMAELRRGRQLRRARCPATRAGDRRLSGRASAAARARRKAIISVSPAGRHSLG